MAQFVRLFLWWSTKCHYSCISDASKLTCQRSITVQTGWSVLVLCEIEVCLQSSFQLIVHVIQICRQLRRAAGFKREKILSAIKGIPAKYSSVGIIVLWWVGKHVCSAPIFMDKVTLPTAGNYHVSKKQIEFIVFPIQRWPLATFSLNTMTQIQTKDACSTTLSF